MTWLDQPGWDSLVSALLHTLWQGCLLALMLIGVLRILPGSAARRRYLASVTAMALTLVGGLATWSIVDLSREAKGVTLPVMREVAASPEVDHESAEDVNLSESEPGLPSNQRPKVGGRKERIRWWLTRCWLVGASGAAVTGRR
jgi:hypothetical protein